MASELVLTRTLHLTNPPQHGADVAAAQHLLTAKGFPVAVDSVFGPATAAACLTAKQRLGYPRRQQIPTCGQILVDRLTAHAPFAPPPLDPRRVQYVRILHGFIDDRGNWDYDQVRPIPHKGHKGRVKTDCSGGATYGAELAGLTDPNGFQFNGLGFTGSLLDHCTHITRAMVLPGDLAVFGAYPGHHVCVFLDDAPDPLMFSHGRQGDPHAVKFSVELAAQARHPGVTYLRFIQA